MLISNVFSDTASVDQQHHFALWLEMTSLEEDVSPGLGTAAYNKPNTPQGRKGRGEKATLTSEQSKPPTLSEWKIGNPPKEVLIPEWQMILGSFPLMRDEICYGWAPLQKYLYISLLSSLSSHLSQARLHLDACIWHSYYVIREGLCLPVYTEVSLLSKYHELQPPCDGNSSKVLEFSFNSKQPTCLQGKWNQLFPFFLGLCLDSVSHSSFHHKKRRKVF